MAALERMSVDEIFEFIDGLLRDGNIAECNDVLEEADTDRMGIPKIVSVLIATAKAKKLLPARLDFHERSFKANDNKKFRLILEKYR